MKRAYVIGHPIRHSISPAMHNAAFRHLGIDARYEAVDIIPEKLASWVRAVRGPDLLGFNVTVPHKEAVVPLLAEIAGDAAVAGAVNTVIVGPTGDVENGGSRVDLTGLNTDTIGFRRSLADQAGFSPRGQQVVLLGAGGAARAVAVVALQDQAASLVVTNRHIERARKLLHAVENCNEGVT